MIHAFQSGQRFDNQDFRIRTRDKYAWPDMESHIQKPAFPEQVLKGNPFCALQAHGLEPGRLRRRQRGVSANQPVVIRNARNMRRQPADRHTGLRVAGRPEDGRTGGQRIITGTRRIWRQPGVRYHSSDAGDAGMTASIAWMATSSMSSSGSRVVRRCMAMPGMAMKRDKVLS